MDKSSLKTLIGNDAEVENLLQNMPLRNIIDATAHDLQEAGLSHKSAIKVEAAVNMVHEALKYTPNVEHLTQSISMNSYIRSKIGIKDLYYENFWILALDVKLTPLAFIKIASGGVTSAEVSIRRIAKYCLSFNATRVVLVHNHPSGDITPSSADMELMSSISDVLAVLEIKVIDSIILGTDSYYSMSDHGY